MRKNVFDLKTIVAHTLLLEYKEEDEPCMSMEDHLSHLYQSALFALQKNVPSLSQHYLKRLQKEAGEADIKLHPDVERKLCKRCSSLLIPGWTATPLQRCQQGSENQKVYWRRECGYCNKAQRVYPQKRTNDEVSTPVIPKVARADRLPSLLRQKQLKARKKANEEMEAQRKLKEKEENEKPPLSKWSLLHAEQSSKKKKKQKKKEEDQKGTDLAAFLGSDF